MVWTACGIIQTYDVIYTCMHARN